MARTYGKVTTIDEQVMRDAVRQVEAAARRLRAILDRPDDHGGGNVKRLSEAKANLHAALARLE